MATTETALTIECAGEMLPAIVHVPDAPATRGVLSIVAGGPQYRAGCGRQLVLLARALANDGIPVMRFDYRGLGDASGPYAGFENVAADLEAAIAAFHRAVPSVQEIVLWGGCDAAAAALIHGPGIPAVKGLALGNPWVHSEETAARVMVRNYYWQRLRDKAFWKKLLSFKVNPFEKIASVAGLLRVSRGATPAGPAKSGEPANFRDRMLAGLQKFDGRILLLMSGQSLVSKEFDELIQSSPAWGRAFKAADVTRIDIRDADQAFSTISARDQMIASARRWFSDWTR